MMLIIASSPTKHGDLAMCATGADPSYDARIHAFELWANAHPEQWGAHEEFGIISAMKQTWPCR